MLSKGGVAYDKARAALVAYGRTLRDEPVSAALLRDQRVGAEVRARATAEVHPVTRANSLGFMKIK